MSDEPQFDRSNCYFCHNEHTELLETHHIVPRRFNGSDDPKNLVSVCPNCHRKLERLYNKRFYDTVETAVEDVDVATPSEESEEQQRIKEAKEVAKSLEEELKDGVPIDQLKEELENNDLDPSLIEDLMQKGEVYEPYKDELRTT